MRRGSIGFVFQSFNLIDELTVRENIELALIYKKTPARERRAHGHRLDALDDERAPVEPGPRRGGVSVNGHG